MIQPKLGTEAGTGIPQKVNLVLQWGKGFDETTSSHFGDLNIPKESGVSEKDLNAKCSWSVTLRLLLLCSFMLELLEVIHLTS